MIVISYFPTSKVPCAPEIIKFYVGLGDDAVCHGMESYCVL
jgi:hypothetical protein